jgi:hypothetical protein
MPIDEYFPCDSQSFPSLKPVTATPLGNPDYHGGKGAAVLVECLS